jgi:two-component system sensor histidine kinase FlrB
MEFTSATSSNSDYQYDFTSYDADLIQESYPGELSELRCQSKQLTQIIEAMPTGLVMLDGNGIVVKVNRVAKNLLDEPILGQAWSNVIRRSFKPRADDWHEVSLKDGRRVKLEISALGNQPGQLIMLTDLTETRLLQDKMSQMQRLSSLGRMVSSLAHQIRTPLSAAMLYGANLATPNLSTETKSGFQSKLMSRLQELEQQVNDMLLFAKSGKDQVIEPMKINQLISDVTQGMEGLVNKANGQLVVKPCQHDCEIVGNKSALSGALQNLVQNSLQAVPNDALINININCRDQHVELSIKDNGKGIDTVLRDKIFEPFFTSKVNGTGLGLAVVQSVVRAHQGSITLVSGLDESAHFLIRLPLLIKKEMQKTNCSSDIASFVNEDDHHDSQ